jgi:hypothetical protein
MTTIELHRTLCYTAALAPCWKSGNRQGALDWGQSREGRAVRGGSIAPLSLLFLGACGGNEEAPFSCSVDLGPGFIGADQALPCAQVIRNVELARSIMSHAALDFGDRLIKQIDIRDVESWDVGGVRAWGTTFVDGRDASVMLGHSMWSLVHELGHVYLLYSTGDSDPTHSRWDSSGQRSRDIEYQGRFEALPPVVTTVSNTQSPPPKTPDEVETLHE